MRITEVIKQSGDLSVKLFKFNSHWKHQERRLGKQSCVVTLVLQQSSDIIWGLGDS